jgi:hypothetical protein
VDSAGLITAQIGGDVRTQWRPGQTLNVLDLKSGLPDRQVAITADGGLNAGIGKSADSRRSPVGCECRRDRDLATLVRVHRAA